MRKRLLIGNLDLQTEESSIAALFSRAGNVQLTILITDPQSRKPKGFAFVDMSSEAEATNAVKLLDGQDIDGRSITVNFTETREANSGSSFLARCMHLLKR